jgi:hypothetical protein
MSFENQYLIVIDPDFLLNSTNTDRFTTPAQYELDVRNALINIGKTEVGSILFRSIKWHGRMIRISPVPKAFGATDATCRSDEANGGEPKDLVFYRQVKPFFDLFRLQFKGIHGVVRFNPHQHMPGGACWWQYSLKSLLTSGYVPTPENVLLHELVHAFRNVAKKFDNWPQTHRGLAKYDSVEEFYAVLVENIYQSELKGHIRQSHQGFYTLERELAGSFDFFKVSTKAFELIDRFCREHKGLTKALSQVKVPFNPIAAYYHDPRKAQQMSRSETAVRRDIGALSLIPGVSWQVWLKFL